MIILIIKDDYKTKKHDIKKILNNFEIEDIFYSKDKIKIEKINDFLSKEKITKLKTCEKEIIIKVDRNVIVEY